MGKSKDVAELPESAAIEAPETHAEKAAEYAALVAEGLTPAEAAELVYPERGDERRVPDEAQPIALALAEAAGTLPDEDRRAEVDQSIDEELADSRTTAIAEDAQGVDRTARLELGEPITGEKDSRQPTPAEVVYAVFLWLTSRDEVSGPFNKHHEAGQGGVLADRFCKAQGWSLPTNWPDGLDVLKPYPND